MRAYAHVDTCALSTRSSRKSSQASLVACAERHSLSITTRIAATMAAPMQAKRDLKAPLSRIQRSNNTSVILMVLGIVAFVAIGGFLFSMTMQSVGDNNAPQQKTSLKGQVEKEEPVAKVEDNAEETLIIDTKHGKIKVVMRPDLSPESVEYIRALAKSKNCKRCNFYRAEKPGILQGIMKDSGISNAQITKGKCPPGEEGKKQDCPEHDPECGCHGPVMRKGMVGWAAGDTGPDFFIDSYERPAVFWGNQHTVFGEIKDENSFAVISKIYTLPVTKKGLTYLDEKIEFTLSMQRR